jgi:hypothetical protein
VPVRGTELYVEFGKPEVPYSEHALIRDTVRCWKYDAFPDEPWRCSSRPYSTLRFLAGNLTHVVMATPSKEQQIIDAVRFLYTACFAAQLKLLPTQRKRASLPLNRPVRRVRFDQIGVRVLVGAYAAMLAPRPSEAECPFELLGTDYAFPHE